MNWTIALPEIVLACCGMAILVFGVLQKKDAFFFASMLTVGAFVIAAVMVVGGTRGLGYNGLFSNDAFAVLMKLLILTASTLAVIVSLDYAEHRNMRRFEFPVLILFATVGMMIMASASNLMTLFMGLELQSLSIYVLAAFARDELRSSEAGLKYFVLGSLASGLLLYGISLIYGFSGTMEFERLAGYFREHAAEASPGLIIGIVFVIAGLAFKVSAVPFHMWTPDVYEGAPTPVTSFLGTAPKVAAMALLMRVLATPFGHLLQEWQQLIVLVSIASMALGALAAIGQRNIKRLMAYSSIGHMGYALIGLAAASPLGLVSIQVYLATYIFMNAGAFALILSMQRRGRMLERIDDLAGIGKTDPAFGLAMTIFMFSMAGIPPFAGFWGKYVVFSAAVQQGMWALAIIGVLTSVIGAYYYIRIIKVMYFDAPGESFDVRPASLSFVAAACGLVTVFFVFAASPLIEAAEGATAALLR